MISDERKNSCRLIKYLIGIESFTSKKTNQNFLKIRNLSTDGTSVHMATNGRSKFYKTASPANFVV